MCGRVCVGVGGWVCGGMWACGRVSLWACVCGGGACVCVCGHVCECVGVCVWMLN